MENISQNEILRRERREKLKQEQLRQALSNKPTASELHRKGIILDNAGKPTQRPIGNNVRNGKRNRRKLTIHPDQPAPSHEPVINYSPFEPMTATFKHSGDLGDLWYSLPLVRYLGGGTVYLNPKGLGTKKVDGTLSGFNPELISLCLPLLEVQPYVLKASTWDDSPVDVDIDTFRRISVSATNLCERILKSFGVPFTEADKPWLECGKNRIASTVFARSTRYRNIKMDYKTLADQYVDSVFVGLPYEHKLFCQEYGVQMKFQPVRNFLELAEIINGADLFIGNQSSPMSIAVGLGKPFIQEVCPAIPDCVFPRQNGQYFLEKYFMRTE